MSAIKFSLYCETKRKMADLSWSQNREEIYSLYWEPSANGKLSAAHQGREYNSPHNLRQHQERVRATEVSWIQERKRDQQ